MRVVMLLHKSVEHDSRVRREARALGEVGHDVTVLHLPRDSGDPCPSLDGASVRSVTPPAWVRRWLPFHLYRVVFLAAFVRAAASLRPGAVHAHDAAMLAPGLLASSLTRAALVYDSHEYAAGVPYRERAWALFVSALEWVVVPRCAAVITVSDGIAALLRRRYGLSVTPTVVRNTPDPRAYDLTAPVPSLRELYAIDGELILHQGSVPVGRGCETLVRAVARLPSACLVFLGADDRARIAALADLADHVGATGRVHFHPSVAVRELLAYTAQADVGVSLLQDDCENHRLALPNKVFEYLAVGVPVVASDLPELRRELGEEIGVELADAADARHIAAALERAIEGPRPAPMPQHSWNRDAARLIGLYDDLDAPRP